MTATHVTVARQMTFTMGIKFALKLAEIVLHFIVVIKFAPAVMGLNMIIRYLAYFHTFIFASCIRPAAVRRAETVDLTVWMANSHNLVNSTAPPRTRNNHDFRTHFNTDFLLHLLRRRRFHTRGFVARFGIDFGKFKRAVLSSCSASKSCSDSTITFTPLSILCSHFPRRSFSPSCFHCRQWKDSSNSAYHD